MGLSTSLPIKWRRIIRCIQSSEFEVSFYRINHAHFQLTNRKFSCFNSPWKSWKQVTSSLSGHFCASLNFIDKAATVQPRYSLRPEGVFGNGTFKQENVFYAALAHESACTENLTPWKKFLPCFHKSGLASLLNAVYLLNSNYFSISIDIKSICGV